MAQTFQQLEARLARVESELRELKSVVVHQQTQPWYRQILGDYAKDDALAEILRLGREIRRGKLKE